MNKNGHPIRTIIAGLGRAGWDIHWRQLLKGNPRFRVVGVVEPLAEHRTEARNEIGCRSFADLEAALAWGQAELAVVATPSGGHAAETLECLRRGMHVVVDKPMCQRVVEADAMIRLSQEQRLVLTCFQPLRFCAVFLKIKQLIESGVLGRMVEIKRNASGFFRRNDWVMRKAEGGGQHNVWGAHLVDQCLQLVNSPVDTIFSDLQCAVTPGDADDHCKIVIRCRNGVVIDAETSNCIAFNGPDWMIAGTRGGLVAHEGGIHLKYFDPSRAPRIEMRDGAAWRRRYENDDVLPWQAEHLPNPPSIPPADFYEGVYAAVREGQTPPVTPESVRPTIAVLEEVRRQNPHLARIFHPEGLRDEISGQTLPLPLRNSAFTLVELLVVIAIIALLAALLSPALKNARELGYSVHCLSNLKQISLAFQLYVEANDGWAPSFQDQGQWANGNFWFGKVAPYANNNQTIFVNCRAAKDRSFYYANTAYGFNLGPYSSIYQPFNVDGSISKPSKIIAFGDSSWENDGGPPGSRGVYLWYSQHLPDFRHAGRANVIFYDHHAASFDQTLLTDYVPWYP